MEELLPVGYQEDQRDQTEPLDPACTAPQGPAAPGFTTVLDILMVVETRTAEELQLLLTARPAAKVWMYCNSYSLTFPFFISAQQRTFVSMGSLRTST